MKVLVAMSGGVDSSAAALLLKEKGYEVGGAIMRLSPYMKESDIDSARAVCGALGIPFYVFDCREAFEREVMRPFCGGYLRGETPNPCVICNKHLKFGYFLTEARELGYDFIATGHYANIVEKGGRYSAARAACLSKDQSYVLWELSQDALSHTLLPLGGVPDKAYVRGLTERAGLVTAHKCESQDICFVPDGDFGAFIERYMNVSPPHGNFIDKNGEVLGVHRGLHNYTIGQRRFLNIALGSRTFVLEKRPEDNTVVLGENAELYKTEIGVRELNFQSREPLLPGESLRADAQIRYGKTVSPARLTVADGGCAVCEFDTPQRAPAPGQSVVFYDGDLLAAGGLICRIQRKL